MKKILLSVAFVAMIIGGIFACSEQAKWNREERQAMRNLLRNYRKMVYLNDLTEKATGKKVIALPIEATAIGNLKVQMNRK